MSTPSFPIRLAPLASLAAAAALWAATTPARADGNVVTLGGGPNQFNPSSPAGYFDGNTLQIAQFNHPYGCAVDNAGHLFVADRENNAVRQIDVTGSLSDSQTVTLLSNLPSPVALAFDAATNLYVVTAGDNLVRKFTSFGNFVTNWPPLLGPTAIAVDANTNIYITQTNGALLRLNPTNAGPAGITVIEPPGTFNQPQGIATLSSGLLAVSDTGNNAIQLVDPRTGGVKLLAGGNGPAFTNGPPPYAAFNQPYQIFQAPSGNLVVADRGNNRVRIITVAGTVMTLYGVDPSLWDPVYPGWFDGVGADQGVDAAACRDPVGLTVDKGGVVYTTEDYYDIIREVTGSALTGAVGGGPGGAGGTNSLVVLPPTISPNAGYYPMGQVITVSNLNSSDFFAPAVYYTTDGSEPTTNSLQVALTNNLGAILWRNTTNDLTSLKLKAFLGSFSSATVSGQPVTTNTIGIPPGLHPTVLAGIGSTVVLPVVVNLATNQDLRSIQYRVDLTPEPSPPPGHFAPNILPNGFRPLPMSTNDAVPLAGASATAGAMVTNLFLQFTNATAGVVTTELGMVSLPNANFLAQNFAAVSLLAVRIPPTAVNGDRYKLEIKYPEGTSDGLQAAVTLTSLAPLEIVVSTNVHYLAGDPAPASWYNAEDDIGFGGNHSEPRRIGNDDVNLVYLASLGIRTPFPFTDLFDAMDVFPEDAPGAAGGDGQIRFLDWQIALQRALGFESDNWTRYWMPGGSRLPIAAGWSGLPDSPAPLALVSLPGALWVRQALLGAGAVPNASPNAAVAVPIYLNVAPGATVAGLEFRAIIQPQDGAPALTQAASFRPAQGLPPLQSVPLPPDQVGGAWALPLGATTGLPPLIGSNLLGYVSFLVPSNAPQGGSYAIQFLAADGAPDLSTQYDFETRPGRVLVLQANLPPPQIASVEWKTRFFGDPASPLADDNADPDHDGVPNWAEYLAGTDPTNAASRLQLLSPTVQPGGGVVLKWLSAPYKAYSLERATDMGAANWTPLASNILGNGDVIEVPHTNLSHTAEFYRVRLQP